MVCSEKVRESISGFFLDDAQQFTHVGGYFGQNKQNTHHVFHTTLLSGPKVVTLRKFLKRNAMGVFSLGSAKRVIVLRVPGIALSSHEMHTVSKSYKNAYPMFIEMTRIAMKKFKSDTPNTRQSEVILDEKTERSAVCTKLVADFIDAMRRDPSAGAYGRQQDGAPVDAQPTGIFQDENGDDPFFPMELLRPAILQEHGVKAFELNLSSIA
jgi:hypothetical protein